VKLNTMLLSTNNFKQPTFDKKAAAAAIRLKLAHKYELGKYNDVLDTVIGEITMNSEIHYVTGARWSAHNLLHWILQRTGPAKIYISTYTISEDAVRLLHTMKEAGTILEIHALIDKRFDNRNAKAMQFAKENFSSLKLRDCHAKVTVLINDNWYISMVGSANYSNNPRIERGLIICNKTCAEFDRDWIMKEINNEKPFGK
jgi:hypothetical protein